MRSLDPTLYRTGYLQEIFTHSPLMYRWHGGKALVKIEVLMEAQRSFIRKNGLISNQSHTLPDVRVRGV